MCGSHRQCSETPLLSQTDVAYAGFVAIDYMRTISAIDAVACAWHPVHAGHTQMRDVATAVSLSVSAAAGFVYSALINTAASSLARRR